MKDLAFVMTILTILGVLTLLATAVIATFLGRRCERDSSSIFIAGIAVPIMIITTELYVVATYEVDGPPPDNVLIGSMLAAAIMTPITVLTSGLTVQITRR